MRRFTREVLQSLPPILDMLLLLLFLILSFTLLGHFLFGHNPDDPFFPKLDLAFVNLFVLLTTAKYETGFRVGAKVLERNVVGR
jgi:two pore calcium channel protein 1